MDQEHINKLVSERNHMIIPRTNLLPTGAVLNILEKIKEDLSLSTIDEAKAFVSVLFQQGGTSRSCDGNLTVTLFNKTVKLAFIRKTLREQGHNRGERKFARALANDIYQNCLHLGIPGNLFQKIQRSEPSRTFSFEEQVWLSDFQSMNEQAPPHLRNYIAESFKRKPLPATNKPKRTGK